MAKESMTKNKLTWRLSGLPTAEGVAKLVETNIIKPEEGREILFNEGTEDKNKIKALEEEVRFLRKTCDTLARKNNGWPLIIKEYRDYRPFYPGWYGTYGGTIDNMNTYVTTTGSIGKAPTYINAFASGGASGSTVTVQNSISTNSVNGLSSLN